MPDLIPWLAPRIIGAAGDLSHRPRRPRRAGRVRGYAASLRPPLIPSPRRPLDTAPLNVLHAVLAGLRRLGVSL